MKCQSKVSHAWFQPGKKSESHRESCAGGFEVMIRARRPGIPGISMYQLGKMLHKYLRVVPENCWYLLFTSINSSLSSNYTPEDLSYHRLNAYSLCCLFVCHCLSHYLFACLPWGFLDLPALQAPMAKTLPGPLTQATWWCYIACVAA